MAAIVPAVPPPTIKMSVSVKLSLTRYGLTNVSAWSAPGSPAATEKAPIDLSNALLLILLMFLIYTSVIMDLSSITLMFQSDLLGTIYRFQFNFENTASFFEKFRSSL
jgi:hypothetical protein